jgi:hypothetical protein
MQEDTTTPSRVLPTLEDVTAFYKAWILGMHTREFQGEKLYKGWGRLKRVSIEGDIGYCCLGVGLKVGLALFPQFLDVDGATTVLEYDENWRLPNTTYYYLPPQANEALSKEAMRQNGISELAGFLHRAETTVEGRFAQADAHLLVCDWNKDISRCMIENDAQEQRKLDGLWPINTVINHLAPEKIRSELQTYYDSLQTPQNDEY